MIYRVKGAILIGIFLTSIVSWPRPTVVTFFPHTPAGDALFDYFKKVVTFHPLTHIGNALDVSGINQGLWPRLTDTYQYNYGNGKVWYALITFLYVDILGEYSQLN